MGTPAKYQRRSLGGLHFRCVHMVTKTRLSLGFSSSEIDWDKLFADIQTRYEQGESERTVPWEQVVRNCVITGQATSRQISPGPLMKTTGVLLAVASIFGLLVYAVHLRSRDMFQQAEHETSLRTIAVQREALRASQAALKDSQNLHLRVLQHRALSDTANTKYQQAEHETDLHTIAVEREELRASQAAFKVSQNLLLREQQQRSRSDTANTELRETERNLRVAMEAQGKSGAARFKTAYLDGMLTAMSPLLSVETARRTSDLNGILTAVNLPADLASLQNAPSLTRGGVSSNSAVELVSPVGEHAGLRPILSWKSFPHATQYTLDVYDEHDYSSPVFTEEIYPGEVPTATDLQMSTEAPHAIRPDTRYRWQVTATFKDKKAEPVSSALASFKTITLAQEVTIAIGHANVGLVSQARHELEAVLQDDPRNQYAKAGLKKLNQKISY